ncbi:MULTISPECIES: hypothetical protein [Pyrobaculum]|uniref:Uncharacterized protein n=2 Tax=Pyrobaculum arsenaticum TaxID=121277 RepID=A4WMT6_PYRAR|nr:hypothetical protein [Pyrobaculum arsenaticum]ABP51703.1 conserved hypothetical protein [Pyrobaculum arsenaticum DSM 13514]MCY0890104.1 hypothetical protein [Pyrobaculum arsenaticum]NYR16022.1 hypothetical protein [Pyrobaculum arsenaticum]
MAKRKEEKRSPTLFDFIAAGEKKDEAKKPTATEPPVRQPRDVSDELYVFIKKVGRASKDDVTKWAKGRGVTPSELYKALEKLLVERKLRKKLDDEGNLVYEVLG